MKNIKNKTQLQIVMFVLVAVITLGIGYATISAINLVINGNSTARVNSENFKVAFKTASIPEGYGTATITNDTTATINVTGLAQETDSVDVVYTVKNESNGIGTKILLELTNSNPRYFRITETIADDELKAGDTTTVTIKVEMIKTPNNSVSTNITGTLIANPIDEENATGSDSTSIVKLEHVSYTYTYHPYDGTYVTIGEPFPNSTRTYSNFAAAKAEFGHPAVLAHILENNRVTESYIAFEKNDHIYYLRGGAGDETGQESKPVYEANVATLKEAFGPDWQSVCSDGLTVFACSNDEFGIGVYPYGYISASSNLQAYGGYDWSCSIGGAGLASCYNKE